MNDYKYIVAWCKFVHSDKYYIDVEIERAVQDGAAEDVCYHVPDPSYKNGRKWIAYGNLTDVARTALKKYLEEK